LVRFEEFAALRLPALLRFATVLSGDPALAEDVLQEVLIRAHQRWSRIDGMERPEPYLRKMIVNEFVSTHRRWWRWVPKATVEPVGREPDPATRHADRDELTAELAKLPRRQRAVLVLRYYEGLSDTEIAEALGCSPGTVRGYASRALAALRVQYAAHGTPGLVREKP
jgi:RNA polymerase sigma-70 factor (sigma-E family)